MISENIITKRLYYNLIWKNSFQVATHQYNNGYGIGDMFGINKSLYSHEFEIKCSKQDFMSEIKDIEIILNNGDISSQGKKYIKHITYLKFTNTENYRSKLIPNYFSFVVPTELIEFAKEKLKGTPYGLVEFYNGLYFNTVIRSKLLHKNKVGFDLLLQLAHRMSYICEKHYS